MTDDTIIAGGTSHNDNALHVGGGRAYITHWRDQVGGGTYVRDCSNVVYLPTQREQKIAMLAVLAQALGLDDEEGLSGVLNQLYTWDAESSAPAPRPICKATQLACAFDCTTDCALVDRLGAKDNSR